MSAYQVSDVTMLFKFHSCKLSHIDPSGEVLNVVGAADNVTPQCNHFLAFDELFALLDRPEHCHKTRRAYVVESKRVLSSSLQPGLEPGRLLRGYRCISAQHPHDNAWIGQRQLPTVRQSKELQAEMAGDGVHDAALYRDAS